MHFFHFRHRGRCKADPNDILKKEDMNIFKCPHAHCHKGYTKLVSLESHIKGIHKNLLTCKDCNKDFSSESSLRR